MPASPCPFPLPSLLALCGVFCVFQMLQELRSVRSSVQHQVVMALAMSLGCILTTAACLAVPIRTGSPQRVSSSMQGIWRFPWEGQPV